MGFSVPSIIRVKAGLTQITMVTCWPSLAENDSRLRRKGRKSRWRVDFLSKEGDRRCFILASDKNEKDQKNLRNSYPRLLPETGRSQSNEP